MPVTMMAQAWPRHGHDGPGTTMMAQAWPRHGPGTTMAMALVILTMAQPYLTLILVLTMAQVRPWPS